MTEISSHMANPKLISPIIELNNNTPSSEGSLNLLDNSFSRQRSMSRVSMSSASSCNSDTSDDAEVAAFGDEAKSNGSDPKIEGPNKEYDIRKLFQSISDGDGQVGKILNQELIDVFPSLRNSFLEKLGLHGDGPRERINEEELEQKFIALALAFTIDAATIKDRCERQRRYRDQTETNLISELDRLIEKVNRIQPLCVDPHTAELLAGLLSQIDVVIRASSHAATSAERFGAVQHEERLAEAVSLMINHVTLLKQQRDSTRKQLQYTKRVLQDTNSSDSTNTKTRISVSANGRIVTRRRASIATVSQPQDSIKHPVGVSSDIRRITRRTSDLTSRVSAFARSSRPSRLELGVDLDKIKEGIVENGSVVLHENVQNNQSEESDDNEENDKLYTLQNTKNVDLSTLPLRQRLLHRCKKFSDNLQEKYEKSSVNGSLHEFFYFSALLCFALGFIVLGNILVELEYDSLGSITHNVFWGSMFSPFVNDNSENEVIKT